MSNSVVTGCVDKPCTSFKCQYLQAKPATPSSYVPNKSSCSLLSGDVSRYEIWTTIFWDMQENASVMKMLQWQDSTHLSRMEATRDKSSQLRYWWIKCPLYSSEQLNLKSKPKILIEITILNFNHVQFLPLFIGFGSFFHF